MSIKIMWFVNRDQWFGTFGWAVSSEDSSWAQPNG